MSIAFYATALLAAMNAVARGRQATNDADPAQRQLSTALWCLSVCMAADAPLTARLAQLVDDRSLLLPWLSHAGAAGFGLGIVGMCLHLRRPHSSTIRPAFTAAALVTVLPCGVALCSVLTGLDVAHNVVTLQPLGSCALALWWYAQLMISYRARGGASSTERLGVNLGLLSVVFGTLWVVATTVFTIRGHLPAHSLHLRLLAGALLAGGFTLSLINTVRRRQQAKRLHQRLTWLWDLFEGLDDLQRLQLPDVDRRNPHELLYRRVIEIRDAQRLLRNHLPAEHQDQLTPMALAATYDLRPRNAEAVAEAVGLAIALEAFRSGRPRTTGTVRHPDRSFSSIRDEAQWLARVATALRRDPLVASIAKHVTNAPSASR